MEMGQRLSCGKQQEENVTLFTAVSLGELEVVEAMVEEDPSLVEHTTVRDNLSLLHVAAANGRIEVVVVFCSVLFNWLLLLQLCLFLWI